MRLKYSGFLLSDTIAQLKRFPLPEPPSDEEMDHELCGLERLEQALKGKRVCNRCGDPAPQAKDGWLVCLACRKAHKKAYSKERRERLKAEGRPLISPTYRTWQSMIRRCENRADNAYYRYGARGIHVCDRWRNSFASFLEDMGQRPAGITPSGRGLYSIDRIDNTGHYEPGNCRWATSLQQARNTSQTRMVTAFGRTQDVLAWAEELGINPQTIRGRLFRGYTDEEALTRKEDVPCRYWRKARRIERLEEALEAINVSPERLRRGQKA